MAINPAQDVLLGLAAKQFTDLNDAEKDKLIPAVTSGKTADCSDPTGAENDPTSADNWGESRTIRAKVIRWLCVDREAQRLIDPRGIIIYAAKIEGTLDLQSVTLPFAFALESCAIWDGIVLNFGETVLLSFQKSFSRKAIVGDSLLVHGNILFSRFQTNSTVDLVRANIAGTVDCSGGKFLNWRAPGIIVGGDVFLRTGFQARGAVELVSANVTGDLDCRGGAFLNEGTIALDASGIKVGGQVHLGKVHSIAETNTREQTFCARGEVLLVGATIAGNLDCSRGSFHNPDANALTADTIVVGKDVLLRDGFFAQGAVRFVGAKVGGDLDFSNTQSREMTLHLGDSHVGRLIDDTASDDTVKASWRDLRALYLDGLVYTAIAGAPFTSNRAEAKSRLLWIQKQSATTFRPQPYQQLAKVFRESGREADAKRVLIAKEWARCKHGDLSVLARAWSLLLYLTIGYGYRPYFALGWAVLWVVLGGFLFGAGYNRGILVPAKAEAYGTDKKTVQEAAFYPPFNRWFYSIDTFVPIINFGEKDYWAPLAHCNESAAQGCRVCFCLLGIRALYVYRWLHVAVGWLLITLVVTGFTNLVRKE